MPSTPVRAAAEGMPAISRRDFIGKAAALGGAAAAGAAVALPVVAAEPDELPVDRVNRLVWELADALNTYADGRYHAVVHPSLPHDCPVALVNTRAIAEGRKLITPRLRELLAQHRRALKELDAAAAATDAVLLGRQPCAAAWRRQVRASDAEGKALKALCAYRPASAAEARLKTRHLNKSHRAGLLGEEFIPVLLKAASAA